MLLVIALRLLVHIRIERRPGSHLKQHRADAVDCREIVRIKGQSALELFDGLLCVSKVVRGRHAGYVLSGVSCGEVKPRIDGSRVEFFGLLEIRNGFIVLPAAERSHALVEGLVRRLSGSLLTARRRAL